MHQIESDFADFDTLFILPLQPLNTQTQFSSSTTKPPRPIRPGIFAFPPNRHTLGGTAYFIVEKVGNILVDSPAWNSTNQQFLLEQGGVRWLFITHRNGIGQAITIQESLHCEIIIQEQEAYLLPETTVTTFEQEIAIAPQFTGIWTPGYSPGSACLDYQSQGGCLFTGRHLLPNKQGKPALLRMAKTFHWFRQLRSLEMLCDRFTPHTLNYLFPGANSGFLRGKGYIDNPYQQLSELDIHKLRQSPVF